MYGYLFLWCTYINSIVNRMCNLCYVKRGLNVFANNIDPYQSVRTAKAEMGLNLMVFTKTMLATDPADLTTKSISLSPSLSVGRELFSVQTRFCQLLDQFCSNFTDRLN